MKCQKTHVLLYYTHLKFTIPKNFEYSRFSPWSWNSINLLRLILWLFSLISTSPLYNNKTSVFPTQVLF